MRRISCTATATAPFQPLGSEDTVSVDTAQPSRPLSLMSSEMDRKGGLAATYLRHAHIQGRGGARQHQREQAQHIRVSPRRQRAKERLGADAS